MSGTASFLRLEVRRLFLSLSPLTLTNPIVQTRLDTDGQAHGRLREVDYR
jgi:hypothetical protein